MKTSRNLTILSRRKSRKASSCLSRERWTREMKVVKILHWHQALMSSVESEVENFQVGRSRESPSPEQL